VNLGEIAASASGQAGVIWTLEESGDLNANLVRFEAGGGVGEHVNDEVDVVIFSVSGSGLVEVNGEEHPLSRGTMVFVPRGARRSTRSTSGDFAYLSVHRRRGPLRIGGRASGWFLTVSSFLRRGRRRASTPRPSRLPCPERAGPRGHARRPGSPRPG
jgi:quercetin dioxygenase-like cupin family protein